MKWIQVCLNVYRASKVIGDDIYRYRISDTGTVAILVKEKNGDIIERSEHDNVDSAKRTAEAYMCEESHNN